ncbi:hypothetical protein CIY_21580 [Butyrivibrio fibrisolvens 16/4]|nr:hypothetical protein CIY_21580 [Butyrivibrio fibrisolvens 16/4]
MKEFWVYWENNYPNEEKLIKKIRKSNKISEYKSSVDALL